MDPILYGGGYNLVNTFVWALCFVFFTAAAFEIAKKLTDVRKFRRLFLPWVVVGGVLRPLVDVGVVARSPLVVTPGIYITVLSFCFLSVVVGKLMGREEGFAKAVGWLVALILFSLLKPLDAGVVISSLELLVPSLLAVVALSQLAGRSWLWEGYNLWIWSAHLFEAAATSVGLAVGLVEQHVLAGLMVGLGGGAGVFLLKGTVLPVVFWLMKDLEDEVKVFTETFVFALGAGPGLRDLLLAAMVA